MKKEKKEQKEYRRILDELFKKSWIPDEISVVAAARRHSICEEALWEDVCSIVSMRARGLREHKGFLVRYAKRFYERCIP